MLQRDVVKSLNNNNSLLHVYNSIICGTITARFYIAGGMKEFAVLE